MHKFYCIITFRSSDADYIWQFNGVPYSVVQKACISVALFSNVNSFTFIPPTFWATVNKNQKEATLFEKLTNKSNGKDVFIHDLWQSSRVKNVETQNIAVSNVSRSLEVMRKDLKKLLFTFERSQMTFDQIHTWTS